MQFSVTRLCHVNSHSVEETRHRNGFSPVLVLRTYNFDVDTGADAGRLADAVKHDTEHQLGWCPHHHGGAARGD